MSICPNMPIHLIFPGSYAFYLRSCRDLELLIGVMSSNVYDTYYDQTPERPAFEIQGI